MQNNPIKSVILDKNNQAAPRPHLQKNEKEKELIINKNNEQYYLISSNQFNNNNSKNEPVTVKQLDYNEIDDEEEMDHPHCLISDDEEDLNELKTQFTKIIKTEISIGNEKEKEKEKSNDTENLNLNLGKNQKNQDDRKIVEKKEENEKQIKEKITKDNHLNVKKPNFFKWSKIDNFVPSKKNNKLETTTLNTVNLVKNIKSKIFNNTEIYDNKSLEKEQNNIGKKYINQKSKETNNTRNNLFQRMTLNILNKNNKNTKNQKKNDYNDINIKENNKKINEKQNEFRNSLNNNQIKYLYNNKNIRINKVNNGNFKKINVKKEECEKKNSQEKIIQTIPNVIHISIEPKKKTTIKKIQPIGLKNLKLFTNKEIIHTFSNNRNIKNRFFLNQKNNKTEVSNNLSQINYNGMSSYNFGNRYNIINKKQTEEEKTHSKNRKQTYDKNGKFNNNHSSYIINKNQKPRFNYNKYKYFNPTASTNYIKFNNGNNISSNYSNTLRPKKTNLNQSNPFDSKCFNNLPIKKNYNYGDYFYDKNNCDTNLRSYLQSSLNTVI